MRENSRGRFPAGEISLDDLDSLIGSIKGFCTRTAIKWPMAGYFEMGKRRYAHLRRKFECDKHSEPLGQVGGAIVEVRDDVPPWHCVFVRVTRHKEVLQDLLCDEVSAAFEEGVCNEHRPPQD